MQNAAPAVEVVGAGSTILIGMTYITQYWFTPPVFGPPTIGTIGLVNMSDVFGQFAAATPGGQANVA